MNDLNKELKDLLLQKEIIKDDLFSLKKSFLLKLNINYDFSDDTLKSVVSLNDNEEYILFRIKDLKDKMPFSEQPSIIFKFYVFSDLDINIKQYFHHNINNTNISKYINILNDFKDSKITEDFDYYYFYSNFTHLINKLKYIINEIKIINSAIAKVEIDYLKTKLDNVLVPISENEAESFYKKVTHKNIKKFEFDIVFYELDESFKKFIFRQDLIKIDNTGHQLAIYLVNTESERHVKIKKSRLLEILKYQFYFVNNLNDIYFIFDNIDVNIYQPLNVVCNPKNILSKLKKHIVANTF
jgi:hypothetical protein